MTPRRSAALVLTAALTLVTAASAEAASRAKVEFVHPVSGKTPFPRGCGVPGSDTPSSEAEPHLAVDPQDASKLVATWQQDRFPIDGGALSNLAAWSSDGGRSWHGTRLQGLSRCTAGSDERSSDPWLSIGPDERVYLSSLTFSETAASLVGAAGPTGLSAAYSGNRGHSFSRQATIVDDNIYDDREAVTADPRHRGRAYVAWVRRLGALGESGAEYFSRTTDGGHSWSAPTLIQTVDPGTLPDPTLIDVLPDGTLLNLYLVANGSPIIKQSIPSTPLIPWIVMSTRSSDGGRTWSAPVRIASIDNPVAPQDPDSGATVRAFPVISVAHARDGSAYVVWNEISSYASARVWLARSADGGRNWGAPQTVAAVKSQAFLPGVAVARGGTVGVSFDDFRHDRRGDKKLTTDVWLRYSRDRGSTWRETHLAGPFDMLTAPPTSSTEVAGRFVGDYQGLVALPRGFGALFAQGKPEAKSGPSDIFYARVRIGKAPKLRVRVRPRRVRPGRTVRFRFRVTAVVDGLVRRVSGVRIRFAGHRRRTNRRGRASIAVRFRRAGVRRVRVAKKDFRGGVARVRVLRP